MNQSHGMHIQSMFEAGIEPHNKGYDTPHPEESTS